MANHQTDENLRGVFLIADRPLCRHGMSQLIAAEHDMAVCGEAESVEQAIHELPKRNASAAVLDLNAPGISAAEMVKTLHAALPELPVLVVAAQIDPLQALRALR